MTRLSCHTSLHNNLTYPSFTWLLRLKSIFYLASMLDNLGIGNLSQTDLMHDKLQNTFWGIQRHQIKQQELDKKKYKNVIALSHSQTNHNCNTHDKFHVFKSSRTQTHLYERHTSFLGFPLASCELPMIFTNISPQSFLKPCIYIQVASHTTFLV